MRDVDYSFSCPVFALAVAWGCSSCTLEPLCDLPEYQDQCAAADGSTEGGQTPESPQNVTLSYTPIKQFEITWTAAVGAETYQLLEREKPGADYIPVGPVTASTSMSLTVPLHLRATASYIVRACNEFGCIDSAAANVLSTLESAIGYVKGSNPDLDDWFGRDVALSEDGSTLAVAAIYEDSSATGIDGDQSDNSAEDAGAVYVFVREGENGWSQQAYIKASNTDAGDEFGRNVVLSNDGNTMAVGTWGEDGSAMGINGDQADDSLLDAGAAYVFVRDDQGAWSQQAYIKASNTGLIDHFGYPSMALSGDGNTLAVGAFESSNATGIDGNQTDESAPSSGAIYVFVRDGQNVWAQQAYVKASNTDAEDVFGSSVALSKNGNTLAVGAFQEDSAATGIDGNQADNSATDAGAVYLFARDDQYTWSQQAYVKASNTGMHDTFGRSVALSGDGATLAVSALDEDSGTTGIDGNQADDSAIDTGAVYVFVHDGQNGWSQQAYIKASNPGESDMFGWHVALSEEGNTLAVSAILEDSSAIGIDGNQADQTVHDAGAVYVFLRDGQNEWSQQAYVKAPNTGALDQFGMSVALSGDGHTLAVSALYEDSGAAVIGGDQLDDSVQNAGAVYLY
jgi:hypothetical protein